MNAIAEDLLKRVEDDERLVKTPPSTPTLGTPDAVRTDGLQSGWLINGVVSVCGGVSYILCTSISIYIKPVCFLRVNN